MLVELFSIHQIGGWAEDTGKVIQLFSSHENLKKLVELIYNYLALAEKKNEVNWQVRKLFGPHEKEQ